MQMKTTWERGPRETIPSPTKKDGLGVATGKNGGPIIRQRVVKVIGPR